jgi:hypothetical protein
LELDITPAFDFKVRRKRQKEVNIFWQKFDAGIIKRQISMLISNMYNGNMQKRMLKKIHRPENVGANKFLGSNLH